MRSAMRRMDSASRPASSASAKAASTMAARVSFGSVTDNSLSFYRPGAYAVPSFHAYVVRTIEG